MRTLKFLFIISKNTFFNSISVINNRYNYANSWEFACKVDKLQNVILSAVILDEWLKELAAITQEHTIISWFNAASTNDVQFQS